MSRPKALLIRFTSALFIVSIMGYCDNVHPSIQGIEIIKGIIERVDEISTFIEQDEAGDAVQWAEEIRGLWKAFIDHNDLIFLDEIEDSKSIDKVIQEVTEYIEQIHENNGEDMARLRVLYEDFHNALDRLLVEISRPVLLAFLGPKCKSWPNCKTGKIMKERLCAIASKYQGKVRVIVIDITKEKTMAKSWKIMLAPTLVFIDHSGKEIYRRSGETDASIIEGKLEGLLE